MRRLASSLVLASLVLCSCKKGEDHPPLLENPGYNGSGAPSGGAVGDAGADATSGDAGAGAVRVLASQLGTTTGLAADTHDVYVTTSEGTIYRVPRSGGAPTPLATGLSGPAHLLLAGNVLLWISTPLGTISELALPGAPPAPFAQDTISPAGLTASQSDVYWVESQQAGSNAWNFVTRPLGGGNKRIIAAHSGHPIAGPAFVLPPYGYFAASDGSTGVVLRALLSAAGDTAERLIDIPNGSIAGMTSDDQLIYLAILTTAQNTGQIVAFPIAGGKPRILADGVSGPRYMAPRAGTLYFTTASGEVLSVPSAGGATATVASGLTEPSWIVAGTKIDVLVQGGVVEIAK